MDELRKRARTLEPILRIGKNGLTGGVVAEIKKMLKKKKLIKIKLLKSALTKDRKEIVAELVDKTGSVLVESVGFVVVLAKPKNPPASK